MRVGDDSAAQQVPRVRVEVHRHRPAVPFLVKKYFGTQGASAPLAAFDVVQHMPRPLLRLL